MIEAERERWLAVKREENTLREFLIVGESGQLLILCLATYSAGSKQGERRLL